MTQTYPIRTRRARCPRVLAGREAELGRIRDQISRVATFGELGGPLLVFHAPRGLGKTSLLRTAQRQALEVGCLSVWVACSRDRPFLPELVHAATRALERADLPTRRGCRKWKSHGSRRSRWSWGSPGLKIGGDVVTRPEAEPRRRPRPRRSERSRTSCTARPRWRAASTAPG